MGCFFGCFRVKDTDRPQPHLVSAAGSEKIKDPLGLDNRLSSLFSREENSFPSNDTERNGSQSAYDIVDEESLYAELKDEAKFLKSCGTLLETPAEIRKASERIRVLLHDGNDESSKFHSWLPGSSGKKLLLEDLPDKTSVLPFEPSDERMISMPENSNMAEHESKSLMFEEQRQSQRNHSSSLDTKCFESVHTAERISVHLHNDDSLPSVSSELPTVTTQHKKCVRFECNFEGDTHGCKHSDSIGTDGTVKQQSPYATPLRLTDEMQTPGTVYSVKLESLVAGKDTRIRSQYVYPVLNPVKNSSQWRALKDSDAHQIRSLAETNEQCKIAGSDYQVKTPMSYKEGADAMVQGQQTSMPVDASLAHWLKPASQHDGGRSHLTISSGKTSFGPSPDMDRPILGLVAAHWNDDEPTHVLPKWWDGNGIPNSTNKYKEDQKVRWHATPFEERLEKALSDERLIPQKDRVSGKPIDFEDTEESDTAASCFQVSTHLQLTI